ncbi:hypothetical protein [Actinomycetospora atypica]|uniref:Uncharacterized protein n=1 Tax=Actinomycetospora atypica TaxID=1290095 RepID=A0ABV9YIA7_9PSEU
MLLAVRQCHVHYFVGREGLPLFDDVIVSVPQLDTDPVGRVLPGRQDSEDASAQLGEGVDLPSKSTRSRARKKLKTVKVKTIKLTRRLHEPITSEATSTGSV